MDVQNNGGEVEGNKETVPHPGIIRHKLARLLESVFLSPRRTKRRRNGSKKNNFLLC